MEGAGGVASAFGSSDSHWCGCGLFNRRGSHSLYKSERVNRSMRNIDNDNNDDDDDDENNSNKPQILSY